MCVCTCVSVCVMIPLQADADNLIARLTHIVFTNQLFSNEDNEQNPLVKVYVKCNNPTDLPHRLSVLRAIRIQSSKPVHLRIAELKLHAGGVATLQGLPAWSCCLLFERCVWVCAHMRVCVWVCAHMRVCVCL